VYIGEVLKNSADMVPKVQGSPSPPLAQTVPIVQGPPPPPPVPFVQGTPPPPPMMAASNSVSSGVGPNVTAQQTYRCIPITTELLKSVVLKPPGERNIRKRLLAR